MTVLRRILGSLGPAYLVRSYAIGLVLLGLVTAFFTSVAAKDAGGSPVAMYAYLILCALLFPFAKLTWDELRNLVFGDNLIVMNAPLMLFLKFVVNVLLWGFAVFIAPFGVLYLWLRTRAPREVASE
ncbi:MAG: hypothetical protein EOQ36_26250 [Mesorhizobium sp.]|uniref:hypothetical protein n=1 Tax=Mesorhizobium sp. TaxID=1871066 RepID=UPI000FE67C8F|nr:hypothetical protein [Mesorhizobium sp.]RWF84104.1 MAG: hypothetical protein EOQ36_26250 [Mesorhizobium sp.]